jgi:hypothetical protein
VNIAVFADVHGRILLAFKLVERYQRETGETIDLILQCGDLGIFPDPSRLDKATLRHAMEDATELGFLGDFVEPKAEVEAVLSRVSSPLLCVRGNHEDHEFLDRLEAATAEPIFPVDPYRRILVLKTGVPYSFVVATARLDLLGIGRIGALGEEGKKDRARYIQDHERQRLLACAKEPVDVLLTHDAAKNFVTRGFGMDEIREFLDARAPVYHFYGHTGKPLDRRRDKNRVSWSVKFSDFEWDERDRGGRLKDGCMGVLHWQSQEKHRLEILHAPWLKEYTRNSWRHL